MPAGGVNKAGQQTGESKSDSARRLFRPFGSPDLAVAAIWLRVGVLSAMAIAGCHHEEAKPSPSVSKPPTVRLVRPQIRDIVRSVGQPSFTQSYERSSVYPKMNAYILKWIVDIGDKVKKGDTLATLFVPELVADHGAKKATVVLDRERIALANEVVEVAKADVEAAQARLEEARADLASYQAEADRWDSETKRLEGELKRGVANPQDVLQTSNRWRSCVAMRDTAAATVRKAEAELLSRRAALSKAKVDVRVAEADLKVAESEEKRLQAWVDYLVLPAPFDGVIVARNANTFDFVLPTTGDPSAYRRSPYLSPSGGGAPIYVVDRTDIIRIFVDIPEQDADYIHIGSKANVLVRAYSDKPIAGTVTRTSWALNIQSRTLRAEIDLPNRDRQLLPGMYAYANVMIERSGGAGASRGGAHALGRQDRFEDRRKVILLDVREGACETIRGRDRSQRRRMDRGHQSPHSVVRDGVDRQSMDAVRWNGRGDRGKPFDPCRRRPC